ncbi:hypothetical protein DFQ28_002405 [Apophysomyces sp. BC1034]|nr:hypothetical protein DFQ29_001749 [Apophysomyces sp. BC1021]KAG0190186.1 hypothetical protein DFQ28_002405 [Apophysomyces sp. BC1034]
MRSKNRRKERLGIFNKGKSSAKGKAAKGVDSSWGRSQPSPAIEKPQSLDMHRTESRSRFFYTENKQTEDMTEIDSRIKGRGATPSVGESAVDLIPSRRHTFPGHTPYYSRGQTPAYYTSQQQDRSWEQEGVAETGWMTDKFQRLQTFQEHRMDDSLGAETSYCLYNSTAEGLPSDDDEDDNSTWLFQVQANSSHPRLHYAMDANRDVVGASIYDIQQARLWKTHHVH